MVFNLIDEPWIPVRTRSGREFKIAPWEITKDFEADPIVNLSAPRPDFKGALTQFLIGLVQTCCAPEDDFEWEERLETPLLSEELREAFSKVAYAFNFDGDGPRFMQDLTLNSGEEKPIANMLIESPGEKTLHDNADHFVKRDGISALCKCCAATALFTLQINAPSGGAGHRTSLRGGGPLTTLVVGVQALLWQTVWLNTLVNSSFFTDPSLSQQLAKDSDRFPWLAPTRTSEPGTGKTVTPVTAHPMQVFWCMPRRIRLDFSNSYSGLCDICLSSDTTFVRRYITKNYGVNYEGAWRHPLTPYSLSEDSLPLPRHGQPGGISYRHWLGLIQTAPDGKDQVATVVHEFTSNRQKEISVFRLWTFGFDMDNMKARCWYESTMPLIGIRDELRADYEHMISTFIAAAQMVGRNSVTASKWALYGRVEDIKNNGEIRWKVNKRASQKNIYLFQSISDSFWKNTEPFFYRILYLLREALEKGFDHVSASQQWYQTVGDESLRLFDEYTMSGPIEDSDPKRMVLARRSLERLNRSKKITQDLLRLYS